MFAGLVRCMDCGTTMCASLRGGGKVRKMTYRCSKYTNSGKETCASHTIREEVEIRHEKNADKWIETVRKYIGVKKIDREMVLALIEEIRVSAQYKVNGKRTQDVEITYKFVGDLLSLIANGDRPLWQYSGKWMQTLQKAEQKKYCMSINPCNIWFLRDILTKNYLSGQKGHLFGGEKRNK